MAMSERLRCCWGVVLKSDDYPKVAYDSRRWLRLFHPAAVANAPMAQPAWRTTQITINASIPVKTKAAASAPLKAAARESQRNTTAGSKAARRQRGQIRIRTYCAPPP